MPTPPATAFPASLIVAGVLMLPPVSVHVSPAQAVADVDRLAWLAGCWTQPRGNGVVEEQWMAPHRPRRGHRQGPGARSGFPLSSLHGLISPSPVEPCPHHPAVDGDRRHLADQRANHRGQRRTNRRPG